MNYNNQQQETNIFLLRHQMEEDRIIDDCCPICLDEFVLFDVKNRIILDCAHIVCKPCWNEWVRNKGRNSVFCPLCRRL